MEYFASGSSNPHQQERFQTRESREQYSGQERGVQGSKHHGRYPRYQGGTGLDSERSMGVNGHQQSWLRHLG